MRPTDDFKRIQQIDGFLEHLEGLVRNKDIAAIESQLGSEPRSDREDLRAVMRRLERPQMELYVDRVMLDQNEVEVALHWEYRWSLPEEKESSVRRGNASMILEGDDELRIKVVTGENPFLAPLTGKVLPP